MQQGQNNSLQDLLGVIIKNNTTDEVNNWLHEKAKLVREEENAAQLNLAFSAVSRKTGKKIVSMAAGNQDKINEIHPGFSINEWSVDRLCRVWLLMQISINDKAAYLKKIGNLFKAAEMNELAALYSALVVFNYPHEWQSQCADGIRSNIGIVLEAIMYNNPYPSAYLTQPAWNQLVLKAFFTEKDVKRIIGLDQRANKELASILIDYAHERWAAHRSVDPQLWRLISPFIDEANFESVKKAFYSSDINEKKASALACYYSSYKQAHQLLQQEQLLNLSIKENKLNWNTL